MNSSLGVITVRITVIGVLKCKGLGNSIRTDTALFMRFFGWKEDQSMVVVINAYSFRKPVFQFFKLQLFSVPYFEATLPVKIL